MSKNSGYSLIELSTALGIGLVVSLIASQLLLTSVRDLKVFENRNDLSLRLVLANRVVGQNFSLSGGSSLFPWLTTRIENDCSALRGFPDCNHSDRLTIANQFFNPTSLSFLPTLSISVFDRLGGKITLGLPCTLDSSFSNKHIIVVDSDSTEVFALWTTAVNPVTCEVLFEPDQQGTVLNTTNYLTTDFSLGSLSFIRLRTYFLNSVTHQLGYLENTSNTASFDSNAVQIILENTYDFQAALGYDVSPQNGIISDNSSATDEVLFNAAGDTFASLGGGGAKSSDLRSLYIAIVVGKSIGPNATSAISGKSFQYLDGPNIKIDGIDLQGLHRKINFRNSNLFQ